jgi:two-component system NtrC family sensor kinase
MTAIPDNTVADPQQVIADLQRRLDESIAQRAATADVLKVISRSGFDLQMVLDTLVESAYKLCGARVGLLYLRGDEAFECKAIAGEGDAEASQLFKGRPIRSGRGTAAERVIMTGEVQSVTDFFADPDFDPKIRDAIRNAEASGSSLGKLRSTLAVPMTRDAAVIGVIVIVRSQIGPFPPSQIELLRSFADQAVIAIENARLFDEVQAKTRDLSESLQQQTATADVLKVISRSAFDLNMVTTAILQAAAQLCRASLATLHLRDGDVCRLATQFGLPEAFEQVSRDNPIPARYPLHSRRQVRAGEFAQFTDAWSDSDYLYKAVARLGGYRAIIVIPMMREDELVGIFSLARPEPEPFTPGQIKLVQTFADQAAIAIENARLFNETKEALERQTATSEILRVISQSPADVQPVFDAIVQTAVRLIRCDIAFVLRCDGATFSPAAAAGPDGSLPDLGPSHLPIDPGANFPSRAIVGKKNVHLPDWSLIDLPEHERQMQALIGVNSALFLPLLREAECIGVLALAGKQANIFGESEIALAESFRDQALIAIENVRLFKDVQAKTADLQESLQQQTATADVLKVISRSAFDLKSVLTTLTESAKSLCGASLGIICLRDGEVMRLRAESGCTQAFVDFMEANPIRPGRATITGRVFMDGKPVHVADVQHDPEYNFGQAPTIGAYRAVLAVPLMRDGAVEGVLLLGRPEPGPFSQRQIDLVQTFADQAVIAIENVRLFEEVQAKTSDLSESLQQQTATAEVLKVISRSAFDLDVVLNSLTRSAVELCNATYGAISLYRGGVLVFMAQTGCTPEFAELLWSHPAKLDRKSVTGRTGLLRTVVQVPDVMLDEDYDYHGGEIVGNYRSISGVPLLRNGELEGVFSLMRREPGNFTARQIELVQTFADQAVIAIENVRLFEQVQARTRELSSSLEELRTAQDRLVQTEKLASLGQLTAGIAHEIKNPLNFVNNFSALSAELIDELNDALKPPVALDDQVREEIDELTQMLKGNLEKVVQHGKRADSIVKNMLLHSREGSGEQRSADINAIVEESLNLAYHGARAEKSGFNITLQRDLDPAAGMIDLYPQEMTRVFLNLISNGFYAAAKRKEAGEESFEPTLSATTKSLGNKVEIRIRDNGTGIPPEVRERMFNPFFTTKPAGEGTGLGLSMSHDIVVKQHGGKIEVDTMPGAFTEFIITLPRAAAAQQQAGGTN